MIFKKQEQSILKNIIEHRRDIRGNRFIDKEIDSNILNELLNSAIHAPSVGFSQPWEFVLIKELQKRELIYQEFKKQNEKAKKIFKDKELYKDLKLEGIKESYLNIAVLYKNKRY